ncbi:helix-turn-helix transcriptional regulator [Paraburkholderia sp. LEh10]|uniref:S24 family peptidase n=1 Tax=Paraburkholderia sp. LEh10 TaxID=2821353 RepID=UPI001AE73A51|nr:S24 family peptidase [Paraburkholderia sp. LEh10]MBP0589307.1 helix-turn-helix transcriptional regulator [Paraburkholderia sp. LEh10]
MTETDELRKQAAARRAARLGELIRTRFERQADFIALIDGNQGEVSALSSIPPKKSFGAIKARKIEQQAGLLPNSLDADVGSPFYAHEIDPPKNDPNQPVIEPSPADKSGTIDASSLTPNQRLKAALVPLGVSAEALAGVAKVGVDVASLWLSGEGSDVEMLHAVAIQNTYGVNSVWLLKGKGDPGVAVRYNDEFRPRDVVGNKLIPVVGMAQLGDDGHWSDLEYPVGHGNGYVDFPSRDRNAYALKCEGDSMSPRIEAGEYVIVEPNTPVKPGKNVMLRSKDGRVMVKKFLYKAAGRTYLISINKAHPPISFTDDEIEKMHFIRAIVDGDSWTPDVPYLPN